MNFDLTKYLGDFGAAIAAAGVIIIGYLNNRTSNNLDTKLTNFESEFLQLHVEHNELKAKHDELRCHVNEIAYELDQYRRAHP